ncbi:hypothetical protein J6590_008622 [Homalodisca vitripennis]|nr:hypothetical protein J6590_008622 [Homalodisca vitripennis]
MGISEIRSALMGALRTETHIFFNCRKREEVIRKFQIKNKESRILHQFLPTPFYQMGELYCSLEVMKRTVQDEAMPDCTYGIHTHYHYHES